MKKWLLNNKIYFEITSMLFFSIMSIILSYTGIQVSKKQFDLESNKVAPKIVPEVVFVKEKDSLIYESVKIYNFGGIPYDLEINLFTILEISTFNKIIETIPFRDYFLKKSVGFSEPIISEYTASSTLKEFASKEYMITSLFYQPNFIYILEINYQDIMKNNHSQFFYYSTIQYKEFDTFREVEYSDVSEYKKLFEHKDSNNKYLSNDYLISFEEINKENITAFLKLKGHKAPAY